MEVKSGNSHSKRLINCDRLNRRLRFHAAILDSIQSDTQYFFSATLTLFRKVLTSKCHCG